MESNMPQRPQPKRPQKPPEPPAPLYACPDPYPPIEVDCVNPHYAQLLKISFASSKSETTAGGRFFYKLKAFLQESPVRFAHRSSKISILSEISPVGRTLPSFTALVWKPAAIPVQNPSGCIIDFVPGKQRPPRRLFHNAACPAGNSPFLPPGKFPQP